MVVRDEASEGAARARYGWSVVAVALASGMAVAAAPPLVLSRADEPLGVVRQAEMGHATAGTRLQPGDIVEVPAGRLAQVEASEDCLIALQGPAHVLLERAEPGRSGHVHLRVLDGWVKVQPWMSGAAMSGAAPQVSIDTPGAQLHWQGGSAVLHVDDGRTEVFAESSVVQLSAAEEGRRAPPATEVARERYGVSDSSGTVKVKPRPDPDFLKGIPVEMRDLLAPLAPRLRTETPVQGLQPVAYADIERWLTSEPALRRGMVPRFQSRLRDATFRGAVESHRAQLPDWREALGPPARATPAAGTAAGTAAAGATTGTAKSVSGQSSGSLPHSVIYLSPTDTPAYGVPDHAAEGGRR